MNFYQNDLNCCLGRALTAATLYHGKNQSGNSCQIFLHNVSVVVL